MSEGQQELKAGHPPAGMYIADGTIYLSLVIVKAGGMRVVTKHKHKENDPDAYSEKYKDTVNPIGGPPVK